jgi:hypothetical protein
MMTDNDNDVQDADEEDDALVLPSNSKPYTPYIRSTYTLTIR